MRSIITFLNEEAGGNGAPGRYERLFKSLVKSYTFSEDMYAKLYGQLRKTQSVSDLRRLCEQRGVPTDKSTLASIYACFDNDNHDLNKFTGLIHDYADQNYENAPTSDILQTKYQYAEGNIIDELNKKTKINKSCFEDLSKIIFKGIGKFEVLSKLFFADCIQGKDGDIQALSRGREVSFEYKANQGRMVGAKNGFIHVDLQAMARAIIDTLTPHLSAAELEDNILKPIVPDIFNSQKNIQSFIDLFTSISAIANMDGEIRLKTFKDVIRNAMIAAYPQDSLNNEYAKSNLKYLIDQLDDSIFKANKETIKKFHRVLGCWQCFIYTYLEPVDYLVVFNNKGDFISIHCDGRNVTTELIYDSKVIFTDGYRAGTAMNQYCKIDIPK